MGEEHGAQVFLVGVMLALVCVGVHYEGLSLATALIRNATSAHRMRVVIAIVAGLIAHVIEVYVFATGWYVLHGLDMARLTIERPDFTDLSYFSFVTYSSLGYGDVVPLGDARLLAGLEALVGLVLIAWTASFTYFEMTLYWGDDERGPSARLRRPRPRQSDKIEGPEQPTDEPIR